MRNDGDQYLRDYVSKELGLLRSKRVRRSLENRHLNEDPIVCCCGKRWDCKRHVLAHAFMSISTQSIDTLEMKVAGITRVVFGKNFLILSS